jgi:deoxyribodipyrimidine photolyase
MKKDYQKSLFIFRRDLRLEDNTELINALKSSE